MRGKKANDTPQAKNPFHILKADSDAANDFNFSWHGVESVTLVELVSWVADAGGITTLGLSSDGDNLYFSVRFGNDRKSYNVVNAQQFELVAKPIIEACKIVCRDRDKGPA